MRKIKLTRANKIILLKALGDYYYRQRTMNTGWRETGYLILKVDSLPVGKKAVFTSEEVCLARNAVNQLRNKRIEQGQYTDATEKIKKEKPHCKKYIAMRFSGAPEGIRQAAP